MGTALRRFGVLAGGDDYPGLNAVIRAAVLRGAQDHEAEFVGFVDGWRGVLDAQTIELDWRAVRGIAGAAGTVLGAAPRFEGAGPVDVDVVETGVRASNLDGLLMIGGAETIGMADRLREDGIPVVVVPASVENCLPCAESALGFDTVVGIAVEAMARLRAIGEAQQQCTIAEVIGRDAGWIALHAGLAAGADVVLVPEWPQTSEQIRKRMVLSGRRGHLLVVAESFGLAAEGGVERGAGPRLRHIIESHTGAEPLVSGLAAVQRGASPSPADRVLAARLGYGAADALLGNCHGTMVTMSADELQVIPLSEHQSKRTVSRDHYRRFEALLG
ncbi:6-phosphofructokinase [Microbacterium sp. UBA3394]|uniref:6-phosphofructokinase n=1 Tax=Microbacterium sp. UBA3394 TaxID=1946945 RepID=UPI000C41DC0A|nr:6-phosphofructokinase [Microbacterium sp. UBA3394]MAM53353.1 6-phosphofructokinase [Microbacterium sp.]HAS30866.1 6-phosphofructokinase [Microbacterium sp.]